MPTTKRLPAAKGPRSPRTRAEHSILDSIRRITRALRLAANVSQSEFGISAAQLYVLRHLAHHGTASISELAAETLTDRSSVAAVVDRLADEGLVRRSRSTQDRRRASVTVTEAGARVAAEASPPPTDLLVSALERLTTPQLTSLSGALTELVAAMHLEGTPPSMLFEDERRAPTRRRRKG